MLRITMLSAIIRARTISCCFLRIRKRVKVGQCDVARGWVGSCVITIKKPRELTGKSRMITVTLTVELRQCNADHDCGHSHKRIVAELRFAADR
jgi:hypothetical protein